MAKAASLIKYTIVFGEIETMTMQYIINGTVHFLNLNMKTAKTTNRNLRNFNYTVVKFKNKRVII